MDKDFIGRKQEISRRSSQPSYTQDLPQAVFIVGNREVSEKSWFQMETPDDIGRIYDVRWGALLSESFGLQVEFGAKHRPHIF